ncbi:MAG: hypothetical protein JST21_00470 [Bacteroidetes bacterium]|nr:hypothetical protein [Bacteroidota bacterium]
MFYFNEKKYNFWDIYSCISKYYPIGISYDSIESFYNSYPGVLQQKKIIEENIYNQENFRYKWLNFYENIGKELGQNIRGTTTGITSCFSALWELERLTTNDLVRTKELHFFVSLLGNFYTIIGLDKSEITINSKYVSVTNFLVVSPEIEYKEGFIYLNKRIEEQFEKYRFVPYFIYKQKINGLTMEYRQHGCTIFNALFNNYIEITGITIIGDEHYLIRQWEQNKLTETGNWAAYKPE